MRLLGSRIEQPAFDPKAPHRVLHLDRCVLARERSCEEQTLLALTNLAGHAVELELFANQTTWVDLLGDDGVPGRSAPAVRSGTISLLPYQVK